MTSAARIFALTLALVLWYQLAGLLFSRILGVWPAGFEAEGFFITGAALPWSALALAFYFPTESLVGATVRDLLFLALIAFGIAANATIGFLVIRGLWWRLRFGTKLRRVEADTRARVAARAARR